MDYEEQRRELRIRTVRGEDGRDSLFICLPALTFQLERIVINGKELDMNGLTGVHIRVDSNERCPVMQVEYIPEYFRSQENGTEL